MISIRKFFGLASNSLPPGMAISLAINVQLTGEDGWKRLAPYGDTDYWEKQQDGSWRKFNQVFNRPQAEEMRTAFNTRASKKRNFPGLPIYIGHPDGNPQRWPDDKRIGKIVGVEARYDGLWVNVVWNDLGRKNAQEGYYIYPSPAWIFPRALANQTGQIMPNELQSVGLTNTPRIADVDAWTNTAPEGGPQPIDQLDQPDQPEMKIKLLKLLGLAENATDEEIETAYNVALDKISHDNDALKVANDQAATEKAAKEKAENEANEAKGRETAANSEATKYRDLAVKGALDLAINSGRITAAERPGWETKLATNFDEASGELSQKQVGLNTNPLNLKPVAGAVDLSTPEGRQLAFNSALDDQMRPVDQGGKGITNINHAIEAIRATPDGKALFDSMSK